MDNISPKLASLRQRNSLATPAELHIWLHQDLQDEARQQFIQRLRDLSPEIRILQVLPNQKLILCMAPLREVDRIAALAGVFWLDVGGTAPLETLLDA
jgi:hypothetical protein